MPWVIEALESPPKTPDYFVGFSAGRCFMNWTDELEFALKFETKLEADTYAANNRFYCGFRIKHRAIMAA